MTTKRVYVYSSNQLQEGTTTVTIAGEVCVPVNNDGSIARGTIGPPPPTDPYGFTEIPSTWETL